MVLKAFYRFCVRILEPCVEPFTIQLDIHENAAPCYHELVQTIQNHTQGLNIDDKYQIKIDMGGDDIGDNNKIGEDDTRAPSRDDNDNDDAEKRVLSDDLALYQALQAFGGQEPIPLVVDKKVQSSPTRKRPMEDATEDLWQDKVRVQHKQKQTGSKDASFKPPVLKWKPTMSIQSSAMHPIHISTSCSRPSSSSSSAGGGGDSDAQQHKRHHDCILPPPFTATSSDETPSVRKDSGVSLGEEPARKKKQRLNLAEDSMHTRKLPEPPLHQHHHHHRPPPPPQHHMPRTAAYWSLPPSPTAALLAPMPPIGAISSSVTLPAISEMIRKPNAKSSHKSKASSLQPRVDHFVCDKVVDQVTGARCGQTFRRSYDLSRHQTIHLKDRPYCHCSFCGKKFTRMDALRRHERVQNHVAGAGQAGGGRRSNGDTSSASMSGNSSSNSSHGSHSNSTSPASRRILPSQPSDDKRALHNGARVNPSSSPTTTPPPSPHAHNAKGQLQQEQEQQQQQQQQQQQHIQYHARV